jgi:hypothetical protein
MPNAPRSLRHWNLAHAGNYCRFACPAPALSCFPKAQFKNFNHLVLIPLASVRLVVDAISFLHRHRVSVNLDFTFSPRLRRPRSTIPVDYGIAVNVTRARHRRRQLLFCISCGDLSNSFKVYRRSGVTGNKLLVGPARQFERRAAVKDNSARIQFAPWMSTHMIFSVCATRFLVATGS